MKPRTLIYDIETAANLAYIWGKYEQNSLHVEQEWHILCFAYKWLGEKKTHIVALPDYKRYKKDPTNDLDVVKKLHELFSEADIVIAHNGDRFDQRKTNARFLSHGMAPPEPYVSIDTLKVARKYFAMDSNKLDDIGQFLKVGRKVQTGGFELWLGCMKGDPKAWRKMKRYNKQDVALLEDVYLKLRPWINNHPAINVMTDKPESCPKCGTEGSMQSRGTRVTKTNKYRRFQCYECGGWASARQADYKQATERMQYTN